MDQLDQINRQLNHIDTRKVDIIDYLRLSIDFDGIIQFTQMKLSNNNDVRIMFSIFGQRNSHGPIELDASLVRSFHDIKKRLKYGFGTCKYVSFWL